MNPDTNGTLTTTVHNHIATITFGHPSGNSFPTDLLRRTAAEIENTGNRPDVSVILLQSAGNGAFCAGASFDELLSISDTEAGTRFFSGFANLINAMRKCPKLIVGRVHGKAVGGGVGLASACDYVFATDKASVKLSELAIGIGPFVIEPAVSRKIGKTAMAEMTLAAHDWKSADWARQNGLYTEIFETAQALDSAVGSFCNRLASYNPEALTEIKKVFWENTDHWGSLLYERAAISGTLVLSDFTREALSAFRK